MDIGLTNKNVLITGGSAGIGLAIARRFMKEGASVAICARRVEALSSATDTLRETGSGKVVSLRADVTNVDDIKRLVEEAAGALGSIDILVNNAGNGTYKPFLEVTDDELTAGMAMNFFSMFRVTQRVVPIMIANGGGAVVNIAGTSGCSVLDPPFFSTCTGPAKAAEIQFTKALAMEFGPQNIRVNCVAPGRVNAPERFERWIRDIAARGESAPNAAMLQAEWGQRISLPGHRWADIEEIANLVVFAASSACGFMTGSLLVADGGESRA